MGGEMPERRSALQQGMMGGGVWVWRWRAGRNVGEEHDMQRVLEQWKQFKFSFQLQ